MGQREGIVLRADRITDEWLFGAALRLDDPRNLRFRATVTDEGFVSRYRLSVRSPVSLGRDDP